MKLGILISGRGSNMQALIDLCAEGDGPAEIAVVVSNKADAGGLDKAAAAGLATQVVTHTAFADRAAFDEAVSAALEAHGVELVCLAGFMRVLTPEFIARWQGRIVNIHPSLLPSFRGLHAHKQALDAGVKLAGCTVHLVTGELDGGPIIAQAAVPVFPGDKVADLEQRILVEEHKLYPRVVDLIARGRIRLDGGHVQYAENIDLGQTLPRALSSLG